MQNLMYGQINLGRLNSIVQNVSEDMKTRDKWFKRQVYDKVSNYQNSINTVQQNVLVAKPIFKKDF